MAASNLQPSLTLPALRGTFGNWIFYSCLMPIHELGKRASYATELHPAQADELSKLIQRVLEGHRAEEIANYLTKNEDRFFNSLVLAVYGGNPDWLEIGIKGTATPRASLEELTEEIRDSIGFLRLSGSEKIFAIDGQHRLSGIKHAMSQPHSVANELVPVIFVGHANTTAGLRRTRRLFTTLNKTAVPVRKRDIIALDEDDVMAITARNLYEDDKRFSNPRIAMITTKNLPPTSESLTTIGNLYDILKLIFMYDSGVSRDTSLRFNRPSDDKLQHYRKVADAYFSSLAKAFPPLDEYYQAKSPAAVAKKHRSGKREHILFRPIGLELITTAAVELASTRKITLRRAVTLVAKLETNMAKPPYKGIIWNADRGTVISKGKTLARRLISYMLHLPCTEDTLLKDYKEFLGVNETDTTVKLPKRVL